MKTIKHLSTIIIIGLFLTTSCQWFSDVETSHSSEKVEFSFDNFNISGELLIPKGNGRFSLVIMVHGDGHAYMSYFSTIKKTFLKAGYATLMWDKPSYGKSTGELSDKHLKSERAGILLTAIDEMKKHPKISTDKIGLWGISQAGYVIPKALEKTDDIAFMILVGCAGETGIRQTAYYIKAQLMCIGVPENEAIEAEQNFIGLFYAKTFSEYYKCAKPLYDNPAQREMGFVSAIWTEEEWKPMNKSSESFFNPMDVFEETKIPTLVFFGDLDKNVDPFQGMDAYKKAFQKANNPNYKVIMIEGADHNIIISETGCETERYARTKEGWSNYDLEYLQVMEEWLKELKTKSYAELLNHYQKQSPSTDPANYEYLYNDLPASTKLICNIIKKQLIHPMEASQMKDKLPPDRYYEDADFPTVSAMLAGLNNRNDKGLTDARKPDERLVVACHNHGLLLVSILRSQGVPVRIRAGFARYFEEKNGVRFGHVICEVWDENEQQWILVDPDRNMVDFDAEKFEFSYKAWLDLRKNKLDDVKYVSALSEGDHAILHILMQDLSCVLGEEKPYWHEPEFLIEDVEDVNKLNDDKLIVFDKIATLLSNPDANLKALQQLYANNTFLHPDTLVFADWYEIRTGKSLDDFSKEFE